MTEPTLARLRIGLIGPLPPPSGGMANQTRQLGELLTAANGASSYYSPYSCANIFGMNTHFFQELESLSIADKRSLGEALIMSADSEASTPLITDAQRAELRARLAHHRANPDEPGLSFAQLKAQWLAAPH